MRIWTVVIVAATVFASVARAPAQTPAPDTLAAARELVVAMKSADQQLKGAIVQDRADVAKDYDALVPLMIEQVNARTSELIDGIAIIYAQNFTAAELRDVTAFYRTPTGQKLLEKVPVIAQQSMFAGQKFGESVIGDLRPRIIEELRKRGHKI